MHCPTLPTQVISGTLREEDTGKFYKDGVTPDPRSGEYS